MFCDLSWCVMMFCHGLWCVVMCCHGSWCVVMCSHGSWCVVMVHDVPWCVVMFHCHGFVMVRDVSLSWFRHGSSWFVMFHCHGFVMVCHGSWCFTVMVSSWFVMCYSLKFSRRSCDPLFSQSGSLIHYQISFLMRFHIFPFPFKEHTSKELC